MDSPPLGDERHIYVLNYLTMNVEHALRTTNGTRGRYQTLCATYALLPRIWWRLSKLELPKLEGPGQNALLLR